MTTAVAIMVPGHAETAFGAGASDSNFRPLTQQEIDAVSGAWILNAIGAIVGAAGGAVGAFTAGGDITDILIAAGAGGVGGAIAPLRSIAQAGAVFLVTGVGAHVAVDLYQIADMWELGSGSGSN